MTDQPTSRELLDKAEALEQQATDWQWEATKLSACVARNRELANEGRAKAAERWLCELEQGGLTWPLPVVVKP